jgi:hypothetical protein
MVTPLPGDIGLTQIHGQVGKLIRLGQWLNGDGYHDYEHAFVYVGYGTDGLVEAEPGGARIGHLSQYDASRIVWSTGLVSLTDDQRARVTAAALRYAALKTPYSFADYGLLAAKRLHIWVPGRDAYVRSSKSMICSQLVARCYADAGVPLFDGWTGDVTPGDLYHLLEARRA